MARQYVYPLDRKLSRSRLMTTMNRDEAIRAEVEGSLNEINEFVKSTPFQRLLADMRKLPSQEQRRRFVRDEVINNQALADRGILVPGGLIVQRSVFADGRPTLFCITKHLSDGEQKVTITFDDAE